MRLVYGTDETGGDTLTTEDGRHQVMMAWEKDYMEACIETLEPSGRVLEIGFGLGYSAHKIQEYEAVTEHVIIECAPVVWDKMVSFLSSNPRASLLKGRWEDVLCIAGTFDCVFFDDYAFGSRPGRFYEFLGECGARHLNDGGRLACYSTPGKFYVIDGMVRTSRAYPVAIPEHCRYAKGKSMTISLFGKVGPVDEKQCLAVARDIEQSTRLLTVPHPVIGSQDEGDYVRLRKVYAEKRNVEGREELMERAEAFLHEHPSSRHKSMVSFLLGYSLFRSNPERSKAVFSELVTNCESSDIVAWCQSNIRSLEFNIATRDAQR